MVHLAKHGYTEDPSTPCLIKHELRPVTVVLVVDDFGIKYKGRDHVPVDQMLEYELTEDVGQT